MKLKEAKSYLAEHKIEMVLAQFVDMHGVPKAKAVPVEHFESILEDGAGFAGFALWGYGMGPEGPDLMQRGDLETLTKLDWLPGYARITCEGYVNGQPYPYDTRMLLSSYTRRVESETGFRFFTGLEPEFYLLKKCPETDEMIPAAEGDHLDKPCYDYGALSQVGDFLRSLVRQVRACGVDVYQIDHEDSNGQYEVNFTYDRAIATADRYILFKMAASTLASQHGFVASFMPKPFSTKTGNGMHMHLSLGNSSSGNLFASGSDPRGLGLSELAYYFMGGVFQHAAAISAVACPTVNSYKRLYASTTDSGATWAPVHLAYGDNNRTAAVRVTGGHLEIRFPDSAANPYLLSAAVLAAGMDGIRTGADPGEPLNRNLYKMSGEEAVSLGIGQLPISLTEAIRAFSESGVLRDALGDEIVDAFVEVKEAELASYRAHVSDWERSSYLTFY